MFKVCTFNKALAAVVFSTLILVGCGGNNNPSGGGMSYDPQLILGDDWLWVGMAKGFGIAAALKSGGAADAYVNILGFSWTDGKSMGLAMSWHTVGDKLTIKITGTQSHTLSGKYTVSEDGNTLVLIDNESGETVTFTKTQAGIVK
jgi:hypothetical protein